MRNYPSNIMADNTLRLSAVANARANVLIAFLSIGEFIRFAR